jgi:hypothetical protein
MSLSTRTSRLVAELLGSPERNQIVLEGFRGDPLRVPVSVLDAGVIASLSNVDALYLLVKATADSDDALLEDTIPAASFTTNDGGQDGSHGVFSWTSTQTNLATATNPRNEYYAVLYAIQLDGEKKTLAKGTLTLFWDGDPVAAGPAPSNPSIALVNQRGTISLGNGVTSGTLVFPTEFDTTPTQILLTAEMPNASGAILFACCRTRTTTSFVWELSGPTPDANHKLHWLALQ